MLTNHRSRRFESRALLHLLPCVALLALLAAGCGADDEDQESSPGPLFGLQVDKTKQSSCKSGSESYTLTGSGLASGTIKASVSGSSVTVGHEDASYNCAAKLKLDAARSGDEILVQETITNPQEKARCMCDFDLAVTVKNVPGGTYEVKVYDAEGKLAGTAQVTMGGAAALAVKSVQGACKSGPTGGSYSFGNLQVMVGPQAGTITVLHKDAFYNCASKLTMKATMSNNQILVQEIITNPGELAYCMCHQDLTAQIQVLAPGTYTVKLYDADGNLVGFLTVTL